MRNPLALLFVIGLVGPGCSGEGGTGGAGTTSASGLNGSSSSQASGTMTASSGSSGAGGGEPYVPPTVPAACGAPTVTPGAMWNAATNEHFSSVKLASNGQAAVAVFAESTGASAWAVKLQWLSESGAAMGSASPIGAATGALPPVVTIAMGPKGAIACFDHASGGTEIACMHASDPSSVTPGLTVTGEGPSIAIGAGGFGLAYGSQNQFLSQSLSADGAAVGTAHVVATADNAGPAMPDLAATDDAYDALSWGGIMWRFTPAFEEKEGNTLAGWPNHPTRIAGSGTLIGAVWADNNQVSFKTAAPDNTLSATVKLDAPGAASVYSSVDVTRGKDSFAAVWSEFEGKMGYRAIDATGAPVGTTQDVLDLQWDDNPVTIVGVSDGFLVAAAVTMAYGTIEVAHLACPQ